MRGLKQSGFCLSGVGERAALEAEQLGFEQAFRNRRAAHIDEWTVAPRAAAVEQPGEQAFARAGFALQQYRWEAMRALSSGEQLPGLLAHDPNCVTLPQ